MILSIFFHVLSELREAGFFIEMDDFGTGESSLAMVAEMPIEPAELDRYFLVSAAHSKRHAEIIQFIIQLAQSLDLHILAEGVKPRSRPTTCCPPAVPSPRDTCTGNPCPQKNFCKSTNPSERELLSCQSH